ncbi:MAG: 16S rRNA (adenine(1518)-N(6)/adenine(1519)-N(6))-dimethyltransferase RsmA [Ktedonobacterales bacterium]
MDERRGKRKPPPSKRRAARHVDALLAHAQAPRTDLLAEAEAEIERAQAPKAPFTGDLTNLDTLRGLLRRHGLRPNKSFGQHLLVDRAALDAMLAATELTPDDNALEVGAGTGVLTVELAQRVRRLVAVELDRAILPVLRETTARFPNVEIIARDLLEVQPDAVFGEVPYKLVANLPYYITALTLRHFLEASNPPQTLVVMVQWEVAQRLAARPGDLSLLGLSVQFYGQPRLVAKVPASAFFPPPQVDSAIVRVDVFPRPLLTDRAERERFFRLAHAGFAEKRKQLHNSLARNLRVPQQIVAGWLAEAGIDPMRRAEALSLDDWLTLTRLAREVDIGS